MADPLASAVRFLRGGGALAAALLAIAVCVQHRSHNGPRRPLDLRLQGLFRRTRSVAQPSLRGAPRCAVQFRFHTIPNERCESRFLAAKGIVGSGLFRGNVYVARNAQEANNLGKRLKPGDQLVLQNGVWRNAALSIEARGTPSQPILIRGRANPG